VGWKIGKRSVARQDATSLGSLKPLARSHGLVIEELGEELLVYDQMSDRAHCLGASAATVWRACDGEKTVAVLSAETGLDSEIVARALLELRGCSLLDGLPTAGMTRRDLGFRAAKLGAAAASVPLIVSVVAPTPAAAITPTPALCAQYNANSCSACCNIIGCCCCCEGGGGTTESSCKLCYPTSTCAAFTCPSATPPAYDSHCSCKGGEFEAGSVTCEAVIQKGQQGSCGCTYTG
jgi:hypothetical protein